MKASPPVRELLGQRHLNVTLNCVAVYRTPSTHLPVSVSVRSHRTRRWEALVLRLLQRQELWKHEGHSSTSSFHANNLNSGDQARVTFSPPNRIHSVANGGARCLVLRLSWYEPQLRQEPWNFNKNHTTAPFNARRQIAARINYSYVALLLSRRAHGSAELSRGGDSVGPLMRVLLLNATLKF